MLATILTKRVYKTYGLKTKVAPVYVLAIAPEKRNDEVKLSGVLTKLLEEDPSLAWEQHGDTHEVILWGQGEIHLQVALDRLRRKYNLPMTTHVPQVPYKETIRKPISAIHGRYKHQSGGHGHRTPGYRVHTSVRT